MSLTTELVRWATPTAAPATRRFALRAAFVATVLATTAAALTPLVRASRVPARPGQSGPAPVPLFEETYRGRHLKGTRTAATTDGARDRIDIEVDGRPLHVMRRADGGFMSMVNHYESFGTPLALARAAVDEIGTAQLALTRHPHHG
ncbi:tyrosinase family oxidase copper chaperone [Streptomyces sp. NPDC006879]|uniref:tyrosinase family oxidase copper chaperone n=1 Tax=Streptomyces sp. NPDC006879 TaxID=3364767 RepID=UPI0036A0F5CF